MTATSVLKWETLASDISSNIKKLVWGDEVSEEVFLRWTQGLNFTEGEPTALIQNSGGPCAVIAPVQSYILKNLLFTQSESSVVTIDDLKTISEAGAQKLLGKSIYDILCNVSHGGNVRLVTHWNGSGEDTAGPSTNSDGQSSQKRPKIFSIDNFHKELIYKDLALENLEDTLDSYVENIMGDFGVLSLLYTTVLTFGLDRLQPVVEDSGEPLVDPKYGHGGQCLVNLLLTGEGVAEVFDGEQDVGGKKMQGISNQSQVGFLTILEAYHITKVGWNLKSPVYPLWVLASQTHLTVLFTQDEEALAEDKHSEALKVINSYDKEGRSFFDSTVLGELMSALGLVSDPGYVDIVKEKLDPENLGIVFVHSFMEEFFAEDKNEKKARTFSLCHYNGIKGSNNSNKIEYHRAEATLKDPQDIAVSIDSSEILKCLQTKWPTVDLHWAGPGPPSLN
ncbi:ubiquitin carboxyl-terminal hydrolase MINDY-3-like [Watersipora subatra]|uniref:ubiquitin carboxyl-terminal hydrolase MINDY-3-like n=1 Tax=Watersipora subatra TaxID=2589382 RepID=UPI00355C151C